MIARVKNKQWLLKLLEAVAVAVAAALVAAARLGVILAKERRRAAAKVGNLAIGTVQIAVQWCSRPKMLASNVVLASQAQAVMEEAVVEDEMTAGGTIVVEDEMTAGGTIVETVVAVTAAIVDGIEATVLTTGDVAIAAIVVD